MQLFCKKNRRRFYTKPAVAKFSLRTRRPSLAMYYGDPPPKCSLHLHDSDDSGKYGQCYG